MNARGRIVDGRVISEFVACGITPEFERKLRASGTPADDGAPGIDAWKPVDDPYDVDGIALTKDNRRRLRNLRKAGKPSLTPTGVPTLQPRKR